MAATDVLQTDIGQQFADKWRGYVNDPVGFMEDILGMHLYEAQKEIARSVAVNTRTAVKACHSSGKTYLAAGLVLWWLYTRCPSRVVTTATTWQQVKNLLWADIRKIYAGASVRLGECLKVELQIAPDWYAVGLSAREAESFQGHHSEHIMVVVDEASGVDEAIFGAVRAILSGGERRLLLIGNPLSAVGSFFDAFNRKELGYQPLTIGYEDTPFVTGEECNAPLIDAEYVEETETEFGRDSYDYITRCLGQFYSAREDVVLCPMDWVMAAQGREWDKPELGKEIQLGLDVARTGQSRSILAWRCGLVFRGIEEVATTDTKQLRLYAQEKARWLANEYRLPAIIAVDEIGVGAGVVDNWDEKTVPCVGVNVAEASKEDQFMLLRDEHYWRLRELLRPGAERELMRWDIPDTQRAVAERCANQLSSIQYEYDGRGRPKIESKDKMRERNMPSPDEAEALMLAFAPVRTSRPMKKWSAYRGKTRESPI